MYVSVCECEMVVASKCICAHVHIIMIIVMIELSPGNAYLQIIVTYFPEFFERLVNITNPYPMVGRECCYGNTQATPTHLSRWLLALRLSLSFPIRSSSLM